MPHKKKIVDRPARMLPPRIDAPPRKRCPAFS